MKGFAWFRENIESHLFGYKIEYRSFPQGDFGNLEQVIIKSSKKSGGIDFWELGWLGIDLYNYEKDEQVMNILLEPHEEIEKEAALEKLVGLLKSNS